MTFYDLLTALRKEFGNEYVPVEDMEEAVVRLTGTRFAYLRLVVRGYVQVTHDMQCFIIQFERSAAR